jgi:hypothetical protein
MTHYPPCVLVRVLQDVAWLMTQYVTRHGDMSYDIARKWLSDYCEIDRNFSKGRVLLIMECMIGILSEMPTSDERVGQVRQFLSHLVVEVTNYARIHDPQDNSEEYDMNVLNQWRYAEINPHAPGDD